jgi:pimeloyl-ACP methyl ester carboxylesterase
VSVAAQQYATSPDGTQIAFHVVGAGPVVVALHGGLGTWRSWLPVAEQLQQRFKFVLVDRRGRGASGAGTEPHRIEQEVDDLQAVLAVVGPAVAVLAHSYGGAIALEWALTPEATGAERLIVYEPGVGVASSLPSPAIERLETLVAAGDVDRALEEGIALLDTAGLVRADRPSDALRVKRPQSLLDIAWTLAREIRAVHALGDDAQRRNCAALAEAIPDVQVSELAGQGHVAHTAAPERVAAAIAPMLAQV